MNLALKYQSSTSEQVIEIIKKMNEDSEFFGDVVNTANLSQFLESKGLLISRDALDMLKATISRIKAIVNDEIKVASVKLFEIVASMSQCNGTGW